MGTRLALVPNGSLFLPNIHLIHGWESPCDRVKPRGHKWHNLPFGSCSRNNSLAQAGSFGTRNNRGAGFASGKSRGFRPDNR